MSTQTTRVVLFCSVALTSYEHIDRYPSAWTGRCNESHYPSYQHNERHVEMATAAAATEELRVRGCHIVAVPFPGRGHINAMMNTSHLFAARGADVTFVVTEEWLDLLLASGPAVPAGVRLRTIPNVIPSEHGRAADHAGFLDAVATEMEAPFERLLDNLEGQPPAAIVADAYVPWVVGVGKRRSVPVWSLFPMSASFFSVMHHSDLLPAWLTDGPAPASGEAQGNSDQKLGHFISCLSSSSMRLSDLEPLIFNSRAMKHVLAAVSSIRNAQCLLFTTMYELEANVIDSLRSRLSCPVYPIGPCIPYMTLEDRHSMTNEKVTSQGDYFAWLDRQPVNSVLYVSLGSFLSTSASQLDEIALGLASSDVRFLWILREQSSWMRQLMGETDKGLILPWCEQLKVLCHPSVGGFLSHCGMNSTLESVFAGVPMLALPLLFDQPIDCRLIVDEWKIGLNLKDWTSKDALIGREDIAQAVKRLMVSDEAEAKAIRRSALAWKEASHKAVGKGGSSYCNLSSLMKMASTSQ